MRDSDVVASIVAGEPEGLALAYDRYAADLYGYCRSLLREPDDAADAVQDTFVIAASKLSGLRDRDRLRAWLFAVARNECLHRLKSRQSAAPLQDAPEPADENADVSVSAERAEAIALVRAAAAGLNDGERDVVNQLWHGLEVPEVADVLGVSRNHAYSLFSRARDQLEASVGVLLVGRTGRRDCAALDRLLGDWDGRLTARLRRQVSRHIDHCGVCSDRRRQELRPAMLYGLTPGALLAMATLRWTPLHAGGLGGPLAAVRDTVLHAGGLPASGMSGGGGVTMPSFGMNGFPKGHGGQLGFLPRPHLPVSVVGGTAVAATATVVATAIVPGGVPGLRHQHGPPPAAVAAQPTSTALPRAGGAAAPGQPTAPGSPAGTRSITAARGSESALEKQAARVSSSPAAQGGAAGSPAATASAGISVAPSVTAGASLAVDPTTAPTAAATVTAGGTTVTGTLTVSPTTLLLSGLLGGSLTLTASGGPVSWSISESSSLLGQVTVTPSAGVLADGDSVTVKVDTSTLLSLAGQLTVEPGGQVVSVVLGLA